MNLARLIEASCGLFLATHARTRGRLLETCGIYRGLTTKDQIYRIQRADLEGWGMHDLRSDSECHKAELATLNAAVGSSQPGKVLMNLVTAVIVNSAFEQASQEPEGSFRMRV